MKQIGTCKECKWFDKDKNPQYYPFDDEFVEEDCILKEYGGCDNPIYFYEGGETDYTLDEIKKARQGKLFLYSDAEDYKAFFYVHESFGCIGWEAK